LHWRFGAARHRALQREIAKLRRTHSLTGRRRRRNCDCRSRTRLRILGKRGRSKACCKRNGCRNHAQSCLHSHSLQLTGGAALRRAATQSLLPSNSRHFKHMLDEREATGDEKCPIAVG